jgi:hypothetical protein
MKAFWLASFMLLGSQILRPGAENLASPLDNQFGTRLVTYVLGTFRYRCLRAGQEAGWPSERQSIPIER